MNRRKLIIGGACLIAAPAIVRYEWLMPVKVIVPVKPYWVKWREDQLAIQGLDETELKELFRREVQKEITNVLIEEYPPVHKNGHLHLPGGLTPWWSKI